jgi:hypothetical protein
MRIDDLGNSGFCTMRLSPSGIELAYIDWLNQRHKTIQFT